MQWKSGSWRKFCEGHLLKVTQLGQNGTDPNCAQCYLIPWLCWSLPVSLLVTSNLYFCATGEKKYLHVNIHGFSSSSLGLKHIVKIAEGGGRPKQKTHCDLENSSQALLLTGLLGKSCWQRKQSRGLAEPGWSAIWRRESEQSLLELLWKLGTQTMTLEDSEQLFVVRWKPCSLSIQAFASCLRLLGLYESRGQKKGLAYLGM